VAAAQVLLGVAAVVGGRLHYVLDHPAMLAGSGWSSLRVWEGMHAAGAILGLLLAGPVILRACGVPLAAFADALAPPVVLAVAILRLGCFLHGCCYGVACASSWCVSFPKGSPAWAAQAGDGTVAYDAPWSGPVHPLQLYFLGAALVTVAVALWFEPRKRYDGQVALMTLLLFALTSALLEPLRGPYTGRPYWGPLPQLLWTALILVGVAAGALIVAARRHGGDGPQPAPRVEPYP
jgi:phosphatidylglycerol:prolipoprotein diacylglycerol transferase